MCCQDVPDARAIRQIKTRYRTLAPVMDERLRRQWAASEAQSYGRGGVSAVSSATGMSRNTIRKGIAETMLRKKNPKAVVSTRVRRPGGGRKALTESDPGLWEALETLVEPMNRGDPRSPLRWTCKSTTQLARELTRQAHPISPWTVEHRMFCHITQNWRGRPLVSHEVIVNLIANVTTQTGLKIRAELDRGTYPSGIQVTEAELQTLHLKPHAFHGDWNYALLPERERTEAGKEMIKLFSRES